MSPCMRSVAQASNRVQTPSPVWQEYTCSLSWYDSIAGSSKALTQLGLVWQTRLVRLEQASQPLQARLNRTTMIQSVEHLQDLWQHCNKAEKCSSVKKNCCNAGKHPPAQADIAGGSRNGCRASHVSFGKRERGKHPGLPDLYWYRSCRS